MRNVGSHLNLTTSTQTDNDIIFKPNDTEAVRITDTGRLGVGTSSPSAKIDIRQDSDKAIRCGDASGSYFVVNAGGSTGIGALPKANADLTLGGGELCMAETTTPTADANFGKIYCKSDNKLYFQDGAGTEHEIAFA